VPFVVGVAEGLDKVVESGDASTIVRWTGELTVCADRIRQIRINGKPLLQDDAMLPAIAKTIRVDSLGADRCQNAGETLGDHPKPAIYESAPSGQEDFSLIFSSFLSS
jgi:hypothetical protein